MYSLDRSALHFFYIYKETATSKPPGPTVRVDFFRGTAIIFKLTVQNTGIDVAEQNLPVIIENILEKDRCLFQ